MPSVRRFELETPEGAVPARLRGEGPRGFVLATGAGTGQDHPGVAGLAERLADAGITVLTFEYAYRAAGRTFPDRAPRLLSVHRAAVDRIRREVEGRPVVLGGRSMGGRMSTMLAAEGVECAGVVAYGYPLHPAGKPDRLRIDHLPDIEVPTLFLSGTRDALATPELVERYLTSLPGACLVWIDDADHSFRRRGTSSDEMLDLLTTHTLTWLEGLSEVGEEPARQP